MGKRELLIALAFGVAILTALQFTAEPTTTGPRRFTLATLLSHWRETGGRTAARAEHRSTGTMPLDPRVREVRVSSFTDARIIGEVRSDIAWELTAVAMQPGDAAARSAATSVELAVDDLGDSLRLRARHPGGGTSATVTIRVPHRLHVRAEDARSLRVNGVAEVRLEGIVGDVTLRDIKEGVGGTHRNGTLRIEEVGRAALTLVGSRATLVATRGETTLTSRNGETRVERNAGPVTVDSSNDSVTVVGSLADVHLSATDGRISVEQPRGRVAIDARRAPVKVSMDAAVPVTAIAREAAIGLDIVGTVPISIDALAIDGVIRTGAIGAKSDRRGRETTWHYAFGDQARVSLRNERGEIVIASR